MKYKITDKTSGQVYTMDSPTPPDDTSIDNFIKTQAAPSTTAAVTPTTPKAPAVDPNMVQTSVGNIYKPQTNQGNPIWNAVKKLTGFGPQGVLTNYAQDLGTGLTAGGSLTQLEESQKQTDALLRQATAETDPAKKKLLYDQVQNMAAGQGGAASSIQDQFSPEINQNYLLRGLGVGSQIAGDAALASTIFGSPEVGMFKGNVTGVKPLINDPDIPGFLTKIGPSGEKGVIAGAADLIKGIVNPYKFLGSRMNSLTEKASANGQVVPMEDFVNSMKQDVAENIDKNAKQLADGTWHWADSEVKNYVKDMEAWIRQGASGTFDDGTQYLDANKLVDIRQYFSGKIPSGFFANLKSKTPDAQIAAWNAARGTATNLAKQVTPGLASNDTMFTLLQKILGPNMGAALKRIGLAGVGLPAGYELLKSIFGLGGGGSFSAGTTSTP